MRYLPVCVDTKNRKLLVLGGGKVAYRKVSSLIASQFEIQVQSADFDERLIALSKEHPERIELHQSYIEPESLDLDCDYLIIATDDRELNDQIESYAKEEKLQYLRADVKSDSTFIMNKVIEVNGMVISISTGGKNPALTKIIAADLKENLNKIIVEE